MNNQTADDPVIKRQRLFRQTEPFLYTRFAHRDFRVERRENVVEAFVTVSNEGLVAGSEVTQVYAQGPGFVRRLVGFAKTRLMPGESRRVSIVLELRLFSHWRYGAEPGWQVHGGELRIGVARDAISPMGEHAIDWLSPAAAP